MRSGRECKGGPTASDSLLLGCKRSMGGPCIPLIRKGESEGDAASKREQQICRKYIIFCSRELRIFRERVKYARLGNKTQREGAPMPTERGKSFTEYLDRSLPGGIVRTLTQSARAGNEAVTPGS